MASQDYSCDDTLTTLILLQHDIEKLYDVCVEWIDNRQEVRRELTKLADELNEHQKNVNIAKVTGSTAAIVGSGLIIGGFVASFFTFGASLIVSAVGAGIGGAGGITAGGAGIAKHFIDKKIYQDAQRALDRDQELTKKLQFHIANLNEKVGSIKKGELEKLSSKLSDEFEIAGRVFSCGVLLGKNILYESIQAAKVVKSGPARLAFAAVDVASDGGLNVFKALSNVGRGLYIGGFVLGVLLLPLDIYTLVTSSNGLKNGNLEEAEKKIREIIEELPCPDKTRVEEMIKEFLTEMLETPVKST